jgi:CBS domain containing-hemolysin-like protein
MGGSGRRHEEPMSDPPTNGGQSLWRLVRDILPARSPPATLRESLEEAIEEHEGGAAEAGDLDTQERTMLRNMLELSDRTVGDVAVPRSDIVALEASAGFSEAVRLFREAGHSRLPVYAGSRDDVRGMLHVKDVYAVIADWLAAGGTPPMPEPPLELLLRQVLFVPPSMPVTDLLADMQRLRTHMAIVVDEYGGTDGLVTIEDIVEEIVGEIDDEHDEAEDAPIRSLPDGSHEVDARLPLEDLEASLGVSLSQDTPGAEVDTLGGLAVLLAGRVPQVNEELQHPSGWRLRVLVSDGRRIDRLLLIPPQRAGTEQPY